MRSCGKDRFAKSYPLAIICVATIMSISLLENLQRSDLNAIEEAHGYKNLIERFNYSQEKVASVIGKSRPYVTNILRLLILPVNVQEYLIKDDVKTIGTSYSQAAKSYSQAKPFV